MDITADRSHFTPHECRGLAVTGVVLLLAELAQWPGLLADYRREGVPPGTGNVIALVLTGVFAIQLIRGRWSLGALIFVALYGTLQILGVCQFSLNGSEGVPSRYAAFLLMAPYIIVHLGALAGIAYFRFGSGAIALHQDHSPIDQ